MFNKLAMKNAHSPAARRKAMETMRRNGSGPFKKRKLHRSPQERAALIGKIDAKLADGGNITQACRDFGIARSMYSKWKGKPHLLKANGGSTSLIDVSALPSRPGKKRKKFVKVMRTPLVKAQLVAKVDAARARGETIKSAAAKLGFHDTQYRIWKKDKSLKAALNGYTHHAVNGSAVRVVLQLNGEDHTVSLQEAISLREGLDALLGSRAV